MHIYTIIHVLLYCHAYRLAAYRPLAIASPPHVALPVLHEMDVGLEASVHQGIRPGSIIIAEVSAPTAGPAYKK